jgi:toxin ParE1/3/4
LKIEWSDYAESDRIGIFEHIYVDSPRNAVLVDQRIGNSIAALSRFPEIGRPGRVPGTRELVIQRTPFIAAYLFAEEVVFILRILHGAQLWPNTLPGR